MKFDNSTDELEYLSSLLLDNLATQEDYDKLCILLKSSPQLRKHYASFLTNESLLHWEVGQVHGISSIKPNTVRFFSFPVLATLAASVVALLFVWGFKTAPLTEQSLNLISQTSQSDDKISVKQEYISSLEPTNSKFSKLGIKSSISLRPFVVLDKINHHEARETASYAIDILEKNLNYDQFAQIIRHNPVVSWNRVDHVSVPAQDGILPYDGERMIRLSEMEVDVDARVAEVSETLQVLDVRELSYEKPSHITKLDAEVYFNKGASVLADSTEFSLSVHALKNNENLEKKSIGMSKNSLHVDSSLITWEKVESQLVIPPGTEFLVVALSARQEGTGALLPNGNGYYADHLKINLMTDDGSVIGPL